MSDKSLENINILNQANAQQEKSSQHKQTKYLVALALSSLAIIGMIALNISPTPGPQKIDGPLIEQPIFLASANSDESKIPFELGSLVTLSCFYPHGWYLKNSNFMILAQEYKNDEEFSLATSFIIDAGLNGGKTVSIRSLNYPDYYLRIRNKFTVVLQQIDHSDSSFRADASFNVKKGLADPNLLSFELSSSPDIYLRQYDDQVIAGKRDNTYQFKDDATWFITPALAKVDYIQVSFNKEQPSTEVQPDEIIQTTVFDNSKNDTPRIEYFNKEYEIKAATEQFDDITGFQLIKGMSYKISARNPMLDMYGKLFFTAKTVRDWTYGLQNTKTQKFIFEQATLISEYSHVELQCTVNKMIIRLPFEATVHFEKTSFTQTFTGVWIGDIAYNYDVNIVQVDAQR
eukprot:403368902